MLNYQMREASLNLWLADHQTIIGADDNPNALSVKSVGCVKWYNIYFNCFTESDLNDNSITSGEISRKLSVF